MEYTYLGNTGLRVSKICLGCMTYGTPGWLNFDWVLDEEASEPFFRAAVEAGITFFDTAEGYSQGRSEEITGRWLKKYANRDEIVIATKVWPSLSRKGIQQACEASLKRLGVEVIDLYQIHRGDPHTPMEETLSALDQLVQQGKVRYIGASSMYAWEFMRALGLSDRYGWARFVSMQNQYNLLYREEERDMMPLCAAEGVGVIPWSPLARGLLARPPATEPTAAIVRAQSDRLLQKYYDLQDLAVVEQVAAIAEERGITMAQVALAWLLAQPALTAPIVGASKLKHLDEAVAAADITLSDDEIQRLEQHYRVKPSYGITPPFKFPAPGAVHDRDQS